MRQTILFHLFCRHSVEFRKQKAAALNGKVIARHFLKLWGVLVRYTKQKAVRAA